MKTTYIRYTHWAILFSFLTILTLTIQLNFPMHNDNVFFIYAAKQWLTGGTYTNNFFDTNPPLIILLNLPVIWIAKITSINIRYAFYSYILFLTLGSFALSYYLLKQIVKDNILYYLTVGGIAFALLILPNSSFGQREHLWVAFSLPYLFAATLRLSNKPINLALAVLIGIFAGLGFVLKPYFLTTLFLLEAFFIYKKRNLFGWMRSESFCVFGVIAIYIFGVYQFFPDYIHTIIPLLTKYYFTDSWKSMIFNPYFSYSFLIICLYVIGYKRWSNPLLSQVMVLAALGSMSSYLLSHVGSFYHQIPMLSFAIILAVFLLNDQFKKLIRTNINLTMILRHLLIWITGIAVIAFAFPIEQFDSLYLISYRLPLMLLALSTIEIFDSTLKKIIKEPVTQFCLLLTFILTLFFFCHAISTTRATFCNFNFPLYLRHIIKTT